MSSYLIPVFTHHGRPITELSRCCPGCCIPLCNKCQPREQLLSEESEEEEDISVEIESDEESDDEFKVISFRDRDLEQDEEELGDTEEVSSHMC